MTMQSIKEQVVYVGKMMFERKLTDISGGNISVRDGRQVVMSPRYAGSRHHWQLKPDDLVCGTMDNTDDILQHPRFSREGESHIAIYQNYPEAQAIIHAHPFHVLPFCVAEKPIIPVTEGLQHFINRVDFIKYAPSHTPELPINVVAGLKGKEAQIRDHATAFLIAKHGIFVVGKDLLVLLDILEQIDWNAWCILSQKNL